MTDLNLCEMFTSFDGEVNTLGQGTPSIFIRLQGCNLNCAWCDTPYAQSFDSKQVVSPQKLAEEICQIPGFNKVTITGGEPLASGPGLRELIKELFLMDYMISVETNGSIQWHCIDDERREFYVHSWVVDYKLPRSNMMGKMLPLEYYARHLNIGDFLKFVIDDYKDFTTAINTQRKLTGMGCKARFAYSSTTRVTPHKLLAEWMLEEPEILDAAILNVQLHKIIWPDERKR